MKLDRKAKANAGARTVLFVFVVSQVSDVRGVFMVRGWVMPLRF